MVDTYKAFFMPIQALWDLTDEISIQLFSLGEDFEKFTYGMKFSESIKKDTRIKDDSGITDRVIRVKMANDVKKVWNSLSGFMNVWGKILGIKDIDKSFRNDDFWLEEIRKIEIDEIEPYTLTKEELNSILAFYDTLWQLALVIGNAFRHPEYAVIVSEKYGEIIDDVAINDRNKVNMLNKLTYDMYPDMNKYFSKVFEGVNAFVSELENVTGIEVDNYNRNRYTEAFEDVEGLRVTVF